MLEIAPGGAAGARRAAHHDARPYAHMRGQMGARSHARQRQSAGAARWAREGPNLGP